MKGLFGLLVLFVSCPATAGDISVDVRCLSDASNGVQLQFRTYQDPKVGWVGGQVRYRISDTFIPLVLHKERVEREIPGRPSEYQYTWLEVFDGRINGEYRLSSQGANLYNFTYTNRDSGKRTELTERHGRREDGACKWW